jgi:hypothetical protein
VPGSSTRKRHDKGDETGGEQDDALEVEGQQAPKPGLMESENAQQGRKKVKATRVPLSRSAGKVSTMWTMTLLML